MILNVVRDLLFSHNQSLKSADYCIRILKNKIKAYDIWVKFKKKNPKRLNSVI